MGVDKQIDEENLLDRNTYRRIKKMDRATLEELIQDIFEQGRKKGLAEAGVIVELTALHRIVKFCGNRIVDDIY